MSKITLSSLKAELDAQTSTMVALLEAADERINTLAAGLEAQSLANEALVARVAVLEAGKPRPVNRNEAMPAVQQLPRLEVDANGRAVCESLDREGHGHGAVKVRPDGRCPKCFTQAVYAESMARYTKPAAPAETPAEPVAA